MGAIKRSGNGSSRHSRDFARRWNARVADRDAALVLARTAGQQAEHELAEQRRNRAIEIEDEMQRTWPAHFKRHGCNRIPLSPAPRFKPRRH